MPYILVTNDDGVHSKGLFALRDAVLPLGEVIVIAPDREHSGVSHALTLDRPLRIREIEHNVISVSGTPTDCVMLAVHELLKDKRPSIVLSGINYGPNMGEDILYSGTVAAAMEGTFLNIPSIAFSWGSFEKFNFDLTKDFIRQLTKKILDIGLPNRTFLNVNFPPIEIGEKFQGVEITKAGRRIYNNIIEKRIDPRGKNYYWIAGYPTWESQEGCDFDAVDNKKISITPLHIDLTSYSMVENIKEWEKDFIL